MVTGMPPRVRKRVDQPPPGKYSVMDGCQVVAARQASASRGDFPEGFHRRATRQRVCSPVPSSVAGPELIRWRMPPGGDAFELWPVTRLTASGLQ
jgi:hypothetical protein